MHTHRKTHLSRVLSAAWSRRRQAVVGLALLGLLALFAIGCGVDTPQNTFDTRGEVADKQKDIFLAAMWPALVIMIAILGGTVLILIRFRRRSGDAIPKQTHGNTTLELAWTIAPALLLLGLGIPMVTTLWDIGRDPSPDAFQVNVRGEQFQWIFEYPELLDQEGSPVRRFGGLGDPLNVPAGREVAIHLTSKDVIHSFWVPKLAGKLDAIPGRTNTMWLKADEPGSFSGQCAEFCGFDHANMRLTLIALGSEDFEAWVDEVTGSGSSASASGVVGDVGG